MNFLEKDLETIIWENYARCAERGMDINQKFYAEGNSYRQMNLAPYGIADLVYIRYSPSNDIWYVQVIELKKGRIDTAAYFQAKRYQTAIISTLEKANAKAGSKADIYVVSVLVGNEVEQAGDFVFGFNTDASCRAFTYSYSFDGIQFKEVGKEWRVTAGETSAALDSLANELNKAREIDQDEYYDSISIRRHLAESEILENGDWQQVLVISPDGVLLNEDLLSRDLEDSLENGAY